MLDGEVAGLRLKFGRTASWRQGRGGVQGTLLTFSRVEGEAQAFASLPVGTPWIAGLGSTFGPAPQSGKQFFESEEGGA